MSKSAISTWVVNLPFAYELIPMALSPPEKLNFQDPFSPLLCQFLNNPTIASLYPIMSISGHEYSFLGVQGAYTETYRC